MKCVICGLLVSIQAGWDEDTEPLNIESFVCERCTLQELKSKSELLAQQEHLLQIKAQELDKFDAEFEALKLLCMKYEIHRNKMSAGFNRWVINKDKGFYVG